MFNKKKNKSILEKDKLHIVYYINVGNIIGCDVIEYVEDVADIMCTPNDDGSVQQIFVPVNGERERMVEVLPTFNEFKPLDDFNKILNENITPYYEEVKRRVMEQLQKNKENNNVK